MQDTFNNSDCLLCLFFGRVAPTLLAHNRFYFPAKATIVVEGTLAADRSSDA
jgi:hypothetical protein